MDTQHTIYQPHRDKDQKITRLSSKEKALCLDKPCVFTVQVSPATPAAPNGYAIHAVGICTEITGAYGHDVFHLEVPRPDPLLGTDQIKIKPSRIVGWSSDRGVE